MSDPNESALILDSLLSEDNVNVNPSDGGNTKVKNNNRMVVNKDQIDSNTIGATIHRSTSAPPAIIRHNAAALFNTSTSNNNNNSEVRPITINGETVMSDDPRLTLEYYNYYYSQKPLDPRLPVPLVNWANHPTLNLSPPINKHNIDNTANNTTNTNNQQSVSPVVLHKPIGRSILSTEHNNNNNNSSQSYPKPSTASSNIPFAPTKQDSSDLTAQFNTLRINNNVSPKPVFSPGNNNSNNLNDHSNNSNEGNNMNNSSSATNPLMAVLGFAALNQVPSPQHSGSNSNSTTGFHGLSYEHSSGEEFGETIPPEPHSYSNYYAGSAPNNAQNGNWGQSSSNDHFGSNFNPYGHHNSADFGQNFVSADNAAPFHAPNRQRLVHNGPNLRNSQGRPARGGKGANRGRGGYNNRPNMGQTSQFAINFNGNFTNFASSAHSTPSSASILDEFRLNKQNLSHLSLETLLNSSISLTDLACDQHGSRFIQQRLEGNNSEQERQLAYINLTQETLRLSVDVFGNYVMQKLLELGTAEQRKLIVSQLVGSVYMLSLQQYGCRVVQKALEITQNEPETQLIILRELNGHVLQCVRDSNANHVIQQAIQYTSSPAAMQFIPEALYRHIYNLSCHPFGCRVIQRLIEYCVDSAKDSIISEILLHLEDLCRNQYGNYVIQHCLMYANNRAKNLIVNYVKSRILQLSKHNFSNNF
jgi:hypothetical protein